MTRLKIIYPVAKEHIELAYQLQDCDGQTSDDWRFHGKNHKVYCKDIPESWLEEVEPEIDWDHVESGANIEVKLHSGEWESVEFFQTTKDGRFLAWTSRAYQFYVYDEIRIPQDHKGGREAWTKEFMPTKVEEND